MYVRTTTRKSGKGEVTYVQLAHNEWDPVKKASTTKVLCSFGRADVLDVAGIKRLVGSLQRLIGEQPLPTDGTPAGSAVLEVTDSRPAGSQGGPHPGPDRHQRPVHRLLQPRTSRP